MRPFTDGRNVERRTVGGAERVIDLTDPAADPLLAGLSLADAEARLAEGLRTCPSWPACWRTPSPPAPRSGRATA